MTQLSTLVPFVVPFSTKIFREVCTWNPVHDTLVKSVPQALHLPRGSASTPETTGQEWVGMDEKAIANEASVIDELREIEDFRVLCESSIEAKKSALLLKLRSLYNSLQLQDRRKLLSEIYWFEPQVFDTNDLLAVSGISIRSKLIGMVIPKEQLRECRDCGELFSLFSKTKNQAKQQIEYGVSCPVCETVREARKEENDEQWRMQSESRQKRLIELRTMPYSEYLRTPEWKALRTQKLKQVGFACEFCSSRINLNVHHRTYERRGYERLNDLRVLCNACHSKLHDKDSL
jgi:hypothetical protein